MFVCNDKSLGTCQLRPAEHAYDETWRVIYRKGSLPV